MRRHPEWYLPFQLSTQHRCRKIYSLHLSAFPFFFSSLFIQVIGMSKNIVDCLLNRRRMGEVYQFASMTYWQKPVKLTI